MLVHAMSARQQWRVANNSNHYPTLAQRLLDIWEGALKQSLTALKNYTAPESRPGSKIPGSAIGYRLHIGLCEYEMDNSL